MPRARNIKPGFFMNEYLAECDLAARLLFIGLWCLADREGRLEDRPKRIGAFVFPYEQYDIDNLLEQLAERGFIIRYQVDGKKYIQVVNFKKHQNPHVREAASEIPAPETDSQCSENSCESMGQDIDCNDETTEQAENNDDTAPCKHHASTMQAPDEHRTSPADSPLLIPDSGFLIPENGLPQSGASTGSSDDERPPSKERRTSKAKNKILSGIQLERFTQFWQEYPRKCAKLDAMRAWEKLNPDEDLFGKIMDGLRRAVASLQWQEQGGKFIPYPATWLNKGRWEDEYTPYIPGPPDLNKRDIRKLPFDQYMEAMCGPSWREQVKVPWDNAGGGET